MTRLTPTGIACEKCGHDLAYHIELHGGTFCFAAVPVNDVAPHITVYCECSRKPEGA